MRILASTLCALAACTSAAPRNDPQADEDVQRVRLYVDAGPHALGAYAVDIEYDPDWDTMSSLEGGDGPFGTEPNVDTSRISEGRFRVYWFHFDPVAPTGEVHVATLLLNSDYRVELKAEMASAADIFGEPIEATVRVEYE